MTVVRSDISSLLQPRPRIPKQLPPPRDGKGKGHKGKGGGKGKGSKGKTKSYTFDKRNQCTYGFNDNKKVTLCMKCNAGECRRGDGCPYFHACSARLQNGRPCMQGHAAKDHRGSTWLEFDNYDAASQNYTPEIDTDIHSPSHSQDSSSQTASQPAINPRIASSNFPESASPPFTNTSFQHDSIDSVTIEPFASKPTRLFLDLFAGHSAPLSCAAKAANIDHFSPFDIDFNASCDIMTICLKTYWNLHIQDSLEQFGLLHLAVYILHSGSMMEDPLHWGPKNLLMVFLHSLKTNNDRFRNPKKYTADQILFALPFSNKEVSLAKNNRSTPWHGKNLTANNSLNDAHATSWLLQHANGGSIFSILGHSSNIRPYLQLGRSLFTSWSHGLYRGKRLPDGTFISALTAEYPLAFASAIINIISPWVSQSSLINQDLSTWRTLLTRNPITRGPRITDCAGDISSANWTIPRSKDSFKSLRQTWIKRILQTKLHIKVVDACKRHQSDPFLTEEDILPFLQDTQDFFPSTSLDMSIPDHQPFRLKPLHSLLLISDDPDPNIATLLQEGIPSGAFSQLQPVGLWEPNSKTSSPHRMPWELDQCKPGPWSDA